MNTPGFTAETSLGWSSRSYYGLKRRSSEFSLGAVRPSLFRIGGLDCDWAADGTLVCGEPSGGGVGFGHPGADPCAVCKRHCLQGPVGKRQSCLNKCHAEIC